MSATQQPYGSIPTSTHDEADEWQAALTRARRDTYEGAEPQGGPGASSTREVGPLPHNIVAGHGHAVRVHDQAAWAQPQVGAYGAPKSSGSFGAIIVTTLVVGAAATLALLWLHQDHKRLLTAKDQQVQRLESQKADAQEARAKAENALATEREQFAERLQALRIERNAALNAASPTFAQDTAARAAPAVARPSNVALPQFPGKKEVSNDPLGGLSDAASAKASGARGKAKAGR